MPSTANTPAAAGTKAPDRTTPSLSPIEAASDTVAATAPAGDELDDAALGAVSGGSIARPSRLLYPEG